MRGGKNVTDMFTKLQPVDTKKIHNIKVSPRPVRKRSLSDTLKSIQTITQATTTVDKANQDVAKETVGTILRSMGEQSSVHGVSRVFTGSTRRRAMWLLFIMTFFGYFLYQFYVILTYYYSYPVKTSITMESRPLLFPSITICNMNPVRLSGIRQTGTTLMKKLMEIDRPIIFRNGTSGLIHGGETFDDFLASMRNTSNTVYDGAAFEIRATDIDDDIIDQLLPEDGDNHYDELDELYILNQRLQQEYVSLSRDDLIDMGHDIDKMLLSCTFAGRPCKRPRDANVREVYRWFPTMPLPYTRFIIFYLTIRRHISKEYGNCYTFESNSYIATKSGPEYGFQMTINLETHEAIPHLTHGYGARLVLHQSGSFPLPAEEGMTLSPGYETSLGVRMTKISRLGQPHGSCAIPLGYFGKRGMESNSSSIRYSNQACLLDCKEEEIETVCSCFESNIRNELYTEYFDKTEPLPNCAHTMDAFNCATAVTKDFLTGARGCYCPNACNETVYSRFFSGRLWPSQEYLGELMESACSKYDPSDGPCPLYALTPAERSMNFLKINVYFEALNYEYLSEEPEYEVMNLLSDIGGSLGLFLGASALSIGEVFELLIELSCYFVQKRRNH